VLLCHGIFLVLMPDTYDVFLRSDTEHTSADAVLLIKLVSNQCEHEIFPQDVGDTLSQSNDPLSAIFVKWILPNWAFDIEVK
jgi:hypothetical protein